MNQLLDISLLELADLYRKKEVSPVEILKKTLERQKELEPKLNAFLTILEETLFTKQK
ncbi:hypothetical protein RZN25_14475 [Bacillaceae bacterium S4-13-56]